MTQHGQKKGRHLRLVRGGCYGRRPALRQVTPLELVLDRRMRDAFLALVTEDGVVASRGIQHVREGDGRPWRVLGRRFKEAHAAGVSHARAKQVIAALDAFVDALYATDNDQGAA